jgi:hypothetical protein
LSSIAHQSETGSIHDNVSDYSDTERFARMAALMAMLGDEINDYGSRIHCELQQQIDEKQYQAVSDTIDDHVKRFKWYTPPVSLSFTISSAGTPLAASSTTRRNRFRQRANKKNSSSSYSKMTNSTS